MILHSIEELIPVLRDWRARAKSIAFAPGCFDLLHAGHVAMLREARRHADVLIVATNTDESIRRAKGPTRPLVPLADRVAMLAALRSVDAVISYEADTPEQLCRIIRPDVMVKGGQYAGAELPGAEFCGRIWLAEMLPARSTSQLVLAARGPEAVRP